MSCFLNLRERTEFTNCATEPCVLALHSSDDDEVSLIIGLANLRALVTHSLFLAFSFSLLDREMKWTLKLRSMHRALLAVVVAALSTTMVSGVCWGAQPVEEWDTHHGSGLCSEQQPGKCTGPGASGAVCNTWIHHEKKKCRVGGTKWHHKHPRSSFSHCACREGFAGVLCDSCANGFVQYPDCISEADAEEKAAKAAALKDVKAQLESMGLASVPSLQAMSLEELSTELGRLKAMDEGVAHEQGTSHQSTVELKEL